MMTVLAPQHADHATRSRLLATGLRQLRRDAERLGAGDTLHRLRNSVLTVEGALKLADARLIQGSDVEVERLLELAEIRIREGRALIARSHYRRPSVPLRVAVAQA